MDGTHSITATQTDIAGNTSAPFSTSGFTLITNLEVPVINTLTDNVVPLVDPLQGTFASGVSTNDTQPTLNGTAPANSLVTIYEGAIILWYGNGRWSGNMELGTTRHFGGGSTFADGNCYSIDC